MKSYNLTDTIFSQYLKLSLSCFVKLLLNFSKFEPQYPYKLYSYEKKVCTFVVHLSKATSMF